jgi:hypothetical protein
MKVPHSIEGLILAPIFAATIFFLKLSCPVQTGGGCFADFFYKILFLPLPFIYKIFTNHLSLVGRHEVLFLIGYWAILGLLFGLVFDIHKKPTKIV